MVLLFFVHYASFIFIIIDIIYLFRYLSFILPPDLILSTPRLFHFSFDVHYFTRTSDALLRRPPAYFIIIFIFDATIFTFYEMLLARRGFPPSRHRALRPVRRLLLRAPAMTFIFRDICHDAVYYFSSVDAYTFIIMMNDDWCWCLFYFATRCAMLMRYDAWCAFYFEWWWCLIHQTARWTRARYDTQKMLQTSAMMRARSDVLCDDAMMSVYEASDERLWDDARWWVS